MSEPTLGIVVVAFNSSADLPALIDSVELHCPDADMIVVDNSRDPATAQLCVGHSMVTYVDPGANVGYASGFHLGLRELRTELVLLLNPDLTLACDPRDVASVDDHTVVTGVLLESDVAWLPTSPPRNVHPLPSVGRELWRSLVSYRAYRWRHPLNQAGPVPQADGAWLLARRAAWLSLGGLDERYELYYEDVDLCRRVSKGGDLMFFPLVVGVHRGGASASSARGLAYSLLGVSRVRYYHLAPVGRWPTALGVLTSVVEFAVRTLARRPEGDAVRWRAVRLQLSEARRPGSVWLLGEPRAWTAPSTRV